MKAQKGSPWLDLSVWLSLSLEWTQTDLSYTKQIHLELTLNGKPELLAAEATPQ
jgi:hypothetical protein